MNAEQLSAVEATARRFTSTQRQVDRDYDRRMRGGVINSDTINSEANAERADHEIGMILAEFTTEQMTEYMRLTNHATT